MEVIEKGIFLTFDEIRILLYGMGVSEIEGVYMPEKIFHETDIVAALHHMSETGLIMAGEDKFRIREDVRQILKAVAYPERTEIWQPHGEEGPAFFLYRKEGMIVASERFIGKRDTLRLARFDEEGFAKWREESADDDCGD